MDSRCFDSLVNSLSAAGTRRGLMRRLAALPLSGTLVFLVDHPSDTPAIDDDHGSSNRRKRRRARHRHDPGSDKAKRKGKGTGKGGGNQQPPGGGEHGCGHACGGNTPLCVNNVCTACSATHRCPAGLCCHAATGQCVAQCPGPCSTCPDGVCLNSSPITASGSITPATGC